MITSKLIGLHPHRISRIWNKSYSFKVKMGMIIYIYTHTHKTFNMHWSIHFLTLQYKLTAVDIPGKPDWTILIFPSLKNVSFFSCVATKAIPVSKVPLIYKRWYQVYTSVRFPLVCEATRLIWLNRLLVTHILNKPLYEWAPVH